MTAPSRALAERLTDAVGAWHDRGEDTSNVQGNLSRRIECGNELAKLASHAIVALLREPEPSDEAVAERFEMPWCPSWATLKPAEWPLDLRVREFPR